MASSPLLSNPILDELYAIRRIMVSMYNAHAAGPQPDAWKLAYYASKVRALDEAIAAYIQHNAVPLEHQEQHAAAPDQMLRDAGMTLARPGAGIHYSHTARPGDAGVRIPGGE